MSSITAWCDMMEQFLSELSRTFPEEPSVKKYSTSFELLRKTNPRKCIDMYMRGSAKSADKIMQKDTAFFTEMEKVMGIDLLKFWTDDLSENTKSAIWQYIQTLYLLGTTITSIPQEALSAIEDVANKCALSMQNGDGTFDEKTLMSGMSGLISSLGGMMGEKKLTQ